jgi:hypothetical protein
MAGGNETKQGQRWRRGVRILPLVAVVVAAVALGVGPASAGNGSAILRGNFDTYALFTVEGTPTLYTFTCDEQRVQQPDGSASESAHCQLDPGQTPPTQAAPAYTAYGYISDFYFFGPAAGFAGGTFTHDFTGVLTPSGNVNLSLKYAAL